MPFQSLLRPQWHSLHPPSSATAPMSASSGALPSPASHLPLPCLLYTSAAQIKKIVESRPFLFTQIADDLFFFETFHVSGMPAVSYTHLPDDADIGAVADDGGCSECH